MHTFKMGKEEEMKKKVEAVIVAGYKVHLHCPKCAHDIQKPLLRTPGVHSVDVKFESGEVIVKGTIDEKKIHQRLEKWSKKKVEILAKDKIKVTAAKEKETTKDVVKTTVIKAYMHCDQCIHNVITDQKAQTITIEGTTESEKLLAYMRKKVHKHAEIVPPKTDKKEAKKEGKMVEVEVKTSETTKIVEFKEETKVEVKTKDGSAPYFVHCLCSTVI